MSSGERHDARRQADQPPARVHDPDNVDRRAIEALGSRIGYPDGEAAERARALAERVRDAVGECEEAGIGRGSVRIGPLLARCEHAREWTRG